MLNVTALPAAPSPVPMYLTEPEEPPDPGPGPGPHIEHSKGEVVAPTLRIKASLQKADEMHGKAHH